MRRIVLTIVMLFIMISAHSAFGEVFIAANDPRINYYGRFDFSTPSKARFNWSASIIEAVFTGSEIGVDLQDGQADYDIEIDGELHTVINTTSGTQRYNVATNLPDRQHIIRIVQRNENHWNAATFGGFYLTDGSQLLQPPDKPHRKIEFIGDSHTAGYGIESQSIDCANSDLRSTTNTNLSFASLVGKAFQSDYTILGWSGLGMVRNYGEGSQKSDTPYPHYYDKTLGAQPETWDFTRWIADLVVINLCTNDFSTTPFPDDTMFINAYHRFIGEISDNYPDAQIMCVSTHTGPSDEYIRRVVDEQLSVHGRSNVFYGEYPQPLDLSACHGHPSVSDNRTIADSLIGTIMRETGWDTTQTTAVTQAAQRVQKHAPMDLTISPDKIVMRFHSKQNEPVHITDVKGRLIARIPSEKKVGQWKTSGVGAGVYYIGNKRLGWKRAVVNK